MTTATPAASVPTSWRPRASSCGYFVQCRRRAWLTAALAEGRLTVDPEAEVTTEEKDSPVLAFGSALHWTFQAGLRADFKEDGNWNDFEFEGFDHGRALAASKDLAKHIACASSFFGSEDATKTVLAERARLVSDTMPVRLRNRNWIAEAGVKTPVFTGHIDLLSDDGEDVIDLKTAGTAPAGGRVKPSHYWQLLTYSIGLTLAGRSPRRLWVGYVGRQTEWALWPDPIDLTNPAVHADASALLAAIVEWGSDEFKNGPMPLPNYGSACQEFCQFVPMCQRAAYPHAGRVRTGSPDLGDFTPFI